MDARLRRSDGHTNRFDPFSPRTTFNGQGKGCGTYGQIPDSDNGYVVCTALEALLSKYDVTEVPGGF